MTVLDELARWVAGISIEDVPQRVLELARHQIASVAGAIYASAGSMGGRAVLETVSGWDYEGACTAYPGGEGRPFYAAILQNCSLSMALDYDDYLFMGHTGHSSVVVPMAVAQMRGADTATALVAQVAANEVAGRLGASVVMGPHNGQMWAHIHLLGAAAAASKVIGLDSDATAEAMGIALAQPVYPLFAGFMGPQSKLLTASIPSNTGAIAAFLAERGMTGPRGILEDPQGFWANFAFLPFPFMFTGLGSAWVTDTIAFKPYPGCAYVDTAVDALLEIMDTHKSERGRELDPGEVASIDVGASLLTVAMDSMSRSYLDERRLSPTNINFSLSISLAIALLAGEISGAQFSDGYLSDRRKDILSVASKVDLRHDPKLTVDFVRALDSAIDLGAMLSQIRGRRAAGALKKIRGHISRVGTMGPREAVSSLRELSREDRSFLRSLLSARRLFGTAEGYELKGGGLENLEMPFGARVRLKLRDGTCLEAERLIPRGGPGDPDRLEVPAQKFLKESAGFLGPEGSRRALEVVLSYEDNGFEDVSVALGAVTGRGQQQSIEK